MLRPGTMLAVAQKSISLSRLYVGRLGMQWQSN